MSYSQQNNPYARQQDQYVQQGQAQAPAYAQQQQQQQHGFPPQAHQAYGTQGGTAYAPPQGPVYQEDSEKFQPASKYKDLWAAIVFLVTMLVWIVVVVTGLRHIKSTNNNTNPGDANSADGTFVVPPVGTIVGILAASVGTGLILSVVYFVCMQRFAGKLIKASLILNVLILVALAAVFAAERQYLACVIWLLMAGLSAYIFWSWRYRIPLAKILLKTVTSVTGQFPATLLIGVIALVLSSIFNALWIASFAGMMQYFDFNNTSSAFRYLTIVFMLFAIYYASQVISNVVHVTVSGLFATYYFLGQPGGPQGKVTIPVSNPTAASAKRAMTTSFGSICFGSLVIAILQTIRAMLRMAQNSAAGDNNPGAALCAACAGCCLGMIEQLVQYFNKWAFVQVAVYGKDYIQAAKDTFALVHSKGIDAIINDQLIGSVLGMGGVVVSLICGFVAFVYVRASPEIPSDAQHYALFIILAVLVGGAEFFVLSNVIDSGAAATFVCLAEDPEALRRTKPQLYDAIYATYPQIAEQQRIAAAASRDAELVRQELEELRTLMSQQMGGCGPLLSNGDQSGIHSQQRTPDSDNDKVIVAEKDEDFEDDNVDPEPPHRTPRPLVVVKTVVKDPG
ncbi:putative choline transporter, neither null mutation nor overexpression affects choline transport [Thoreauomyces humboldtii]|nr:putative choline transporter, neither null mutation nor overexpression affects choline transport [Thoreauomyces humboldtii]